MKHTRLEQTHLSNGDYISITRHGNAYGFMHGFNSFIEAPESHIHLTKSEAYKMYADTLRDDVTEVKGK